MNDKKNTPKSFELETVGPPYMTYETLAEHEGEAWYTHGDWVKYEDMVEELHGAAMWIELLIERIEEAQQ